MGRGRAKAKQTKVARQLKYFSPATDLERLRAELSGAPPEAAHVADETAPDELDDGLDDLDGADDGEFAADFDDEANHSGRR